MIQAGRHNIVTQAVAVDTFESFDNFLSMELNKLGLNNWANKLLVL